MNANQMARLVVNPGSEKSFLAPLPIEKMPMVGNKTAALLRSIGVENYL